MNSFLKEFLLVLGFSSVFFGLHSIYPPVAYIICGIMVVYAVYPRETDQKEKEK